MRPFRSVGVSNETEIVNIIHKLQLMQRPLRCKISNSYGNKLMIMQSSCRVNPSNDGRLILRKPRLYQVSDVVKLVFIFTESKPGRTRDCLLSSSFNLLDVGRDHCSPLSLKLNKIKVVIMEFTFSGKENKITAQKFCSGRNHFYFIKI